VSSRIQLGDFQLTLVNDGTYLADGGAMFGIVPKTLWQKRIPADDQNRIASALNSVLIDTGKQKILVETGIGNKLGEKMRSFYQPQAKLLENLAAIGVKPEQIDMVINSHLHFDHCGWNTVMQNGAAVAAFPRAKYYAPRGEWEAAKLQRERDAVSYISNNYDPLIQTGQMELRANDSEVVPGVSLRIYPGHTRSMMAIIVESGGKKACYISDLVPTTAHLDLTWALSYDLFPLETIESKKLFYKEAIPGKWLVIFTHDAKVPCAYVEAGEKGKFIARPLA